MKIHLNFLAPKIGVQPDRLVQELLATCVGVGGSEASENFRNAALQNYLYENIACAFISASSAYEMVEHNYVVVVNFLFEVDLSEDQFNLFSNLIRTFCKNSSLSLLGLNRE